MSKSEQLISILKKHQAAFHPVVHFDAAKEKICLLDFTENNKELDKNILAHTNRFIQHINDKLQQAGAKYGIGGYAEHRTVYSRSKVFDATSPGEEPRRLHLGIDIWGKPHTAVIAPLNGIVHSFAFNDNFGDYGATIILSHRLEEFSFYTLYGHLSLNSLKNLNGGERIEKGDVFAEFGIPLENGHWPPHLHFQIIIDLQGYEGDYPGVCKFSEREKYLDNCPDPDLILQLNQYL
ncbi:MAG TPA: peptidoglycan DD-metalloendopeptidase family protein [Chitinophagaceae bacterium]|jgi:murein DD-endopeptidase MepM/ murein hydrolase activator NlpD|nr:peptidoglycan DD-metalloendopeptidase family protein [Chitinophagaceae bacterium]